MTTWPHVEESSWKRRQPLKYRDGSEKTETVVLYSSTVTANSDGRRLLEAGTILCEISSGLGDGKFGPYDPDAGDGRQTLGVNASYVLSQGVDATLVDKAVGGYWADCVFDASEIRDVNAVSSSDLSALKTAFPLAGWK